MNNELNNSRKEIDKIDNNMPKLLADSFGVTQKVGEYKNKND